jgi:hypothetical protein
MKPKLIFIASAYQGDVNNVMRSMEYADAIIEMGHHPIVPLLFHFMDEIHPQHEEKWKEIDKNILKRCDMVFRDESVSQGADDEVSEARRLGIPVVYWLEDIDAVKITKREELFRYISDLYGVDEELLIKGRRDRIYADPRHMMTYIMYRHYGYTAQRVADIIGYKNHASVVHAAKKIRYDLETNYIPTVQKYNALKPHLPEVGNTK